MPHNKIRKKNKKKNSLWPRILILTGIALVIALIFIIKNQTTEEPVSVVNLSAEAQLDKHLKDGKPVFVFYHSTDCYSCQVMMATVAEVFPEYEANVALVDINVYDPANKNLLREEQIHSIPTQVFYNRKGQSTVIIGIMEADALRQQLNTLLDGS